MVKAKSRLNNKKQVIMIRFVELLCIATSLYLDTVFSVLLLSVFVFDGFEEHDKVREALDPSEQHIYDKIYQRYRGNFAAGVLICLLALLWCSKLCREFLEEEKEEPLNPEKVDGVVNQHTDSSQRDDFTILEEFYKHSRYPKVEYLKGCTKLDSSTIRTWFRKRRLLESQNKEDGLMKKRVQEKNPSQSTPPTIPITTTISNSTQTIIPKERLVIWSGVLEWAEQVKEPSDTVQKIVRQLSCQISTRLIAGEAEVKGNESWQKLFMQLIPKYIVDNLGGTYLRDAKTVLLSLENCDALTSILDSGFVGCVHFFTKQGTSSPIKVLLLFYSRERREYMGFIPNDQTGLVDRMRGVIQLEEIEKQKNIMKLEQAHQIVKEERARDFL